MLLYFYKFDELSHQREVFVYKYLNIVEISCTGDSCLLQLWKYPFAQVLFDSDPAPREMSDIPMKMEEMSQAMIRYFFFFHREKKVCFFNRRYS